MNNKCQLCESDVRQDLVPIHIKHYHNIPQCNIIISLVRRIEALEKKIRELEERIKETRVEEMEFVDRK